ncbi:MAG: hypothetical protein ACP5T4_00840 [Candidatus Micrarchaeia archaeon]
MQQKRVKSKKEEEPSKEKEPKILIKPIGKFGGLDGIHVALLVVIALLVSLLLVVSYSKPVYIKQNVTQNVTPLHNESQVLSIVKRFLASYSYVNTSLSILPYVSEVQKANATYVPALNQWVVAMPAINPNTNQSFLISFIVNDKNLSDITPFIETARPSKLLNDSAVYQGVISLAGKYPCLTQAPMQVYWFIDPYAPGAIRSLFNMTSLEAKFGNKVNFEIKIVNTGATNAIARQQGIANAELLGKYLFCASNQTEFDTFVSNLNSIYAGSFINRNELNMLAYESKLNLTQLSNCVNSSQSTIDNQLLLAQFYNITTTPSVIVDCKYLALPETAQQAICYANSSVCR